MKIKITYTAAEATRFERIRADLIQSVPDARQHTSTAPGGVLIWYLNACKKPRERWRRLK